MTNRQRGRSKAGQIPTVGPPPPDPAEQSVYIRVTTNKNLAIEAWLSWGSLAGSGVIGLAGLVASQHLPPVEAVIVILVTIVAVVLIVLGTQWLKARSTGGGSPPVSQGRRRR